MIKKICDEIDQSVKRNKVLFIFLIVWLLMNLIQAFFTQLHPDEAYYWMYSKNLAWGYFDHPPMVAIIVKAGSFLFHNELGVRLLHSVMGGGTIFFIYKIIEEYLKSISLFIIILCSMVIIHSHIGSFLAIPDTPVVFFTTLFFLLYKHYLREDKWQYAIMLGFVGAAMLYSKYHGVLVIFFTLISNLKLLKRKTVWIVPAIIIIIMLPHLYWQLNNNFPTFQYHLISRSSHYKLAYTTNYLLEQLVMSGPFIGFILLYQSFRPLIIRDAFMRGLKFNFIGFLVFFFFMSFKGRVEPHWTALGYIPVVILAILRIQENKKAIGWIRFMFLPTIIIFLILRVSLMMQIFPEKYNITKDFHGWDKWANEIRTYANGRKVVFVNSFQQPSKYAFYTGGEFAHSLNSIHYRQNQYDIWNGENSIQGENILLVGAYYLYDTLETSIGPYRVRKIDNFHSFYNNIKIKTNRQEVSCLRGDEILIDYEMFNLTDDTIKFISADDNYPPCISVTYHDVKKFTSTINLDTLYGKIEPSGIYKGQIRLKVPDTPGKYLGYISITNDLLLPSFNSKPIKVKIAGN